jgi:hypothetical protein
VIYYPRDWPGQGTIHVLRDALLVAGVVGISIEKFAASLLVSRTAAEISERLVGYGLPRDAQTVISSIVNTTRVYRNYHKSYRFTVLDQDTLLVRIIVSYLVVNKRQNAICQNTRKREYTARY